MVNRIWSSLLLASALHLPARAQSATQTFTLPISGPPIVVTGGGGGPGGVFSLGTVALQPGTVDYVVGLNQQQSIAVDSNTNDWSISLAASSTSSEVTGLYYLGGGQVVAEASNLNVGTSGEVSGAANQNAQVGPVKCVSTAAGPASSDSGRNLGRWTWYPGSSWKVRFANSAIASGNYSWSVVITVSSAP